MDREEVIWKCKRIDIQERRAHTRADKDRNTYRKTHTWAKSTTRTLMALLLCYFPVSFVAEKCTIASTGNPCFGVLFLPNPGIASHPNYLQPISQAHQNVFLELPILGLLARLQLWPLCLQRCGNYLGLEGDTLYIFFQPNLVIFIIFGVKSI